MNTDRVGRTLYPVHSSEAFEDSPAFLLAAEAIEECWGDSKPALGVGRPAWWIQDGDVPVAFLVYGLEPESRLLWLDFVYVQRSHRRQGLCKALLNNVINTAEQLRLKFVACEVNASNNSMLQCLERFGFSFEPDQESYLLAARTL